MPVFDPINSFTVPPIVFFIPKALWPLTLPKSADENWSGFGLGLYTWTVQTYLRLKSVGFPCHLSSTLPEEGIVLFHSNAARNHRDLLQPNPARLLICIKAESSPYPEAQLHVVQNPLETKTVRHSYFLPHWPQPGLLPRETGRGNRFETISFLGHINNIAPELLTANWSERLSKLGLRWQPMINDNPWNDSTTLIPHWHDYRQVDAVVAIRSFDRKSLYRTQFYQNKPATKLYNAWLAGVPAILGPESAYRALRQSPFDYREVNTVEGLWIALKQLKEDPDLRARMVKHGNLRAKSFDSEQITQQWQTFLEQVAIPSYKQWCAQSKLGQSLWILQSQSQSYQIRTGNRVRTLINR